MAEVNVDEQLLELSEGRVLAYAEGGEPSSTEVVIFFHGVFGVGKVPTTTPPPLEERHVHCINPTLPGWGNSSSVPPHMTFHDYLYEVITALLTHLHPNSENLRLYIAGGSFGTVPAQMLYGAPYEKFPLGRHIAGLLLLAPFSPFHAHKEYNKCLTWPNYIMIGRPGYLLPFKLIPRIASLGMKGKVDTREHAEKFIHEFAFAKMTPVERELCERWKAKRGIKNGDEGKDLADMIYRSVQKTWDGFLALPSITHSGWGGYSPANLDEEHAKPVLIVLSHNDWEMKKMGEWLGSQLKNSRVRYEEGGHIAGMFVMDDIWQDFFSRIPQ
ncbi:hypothetical protein PHLCEN_2v12321 [Hermanssonia centrifuga]|uniref:AB hydrolase-1 domain-containing protein n=1 Tax=Hermanssonia centrifuga TaxID=98765 RepID=A0A2R6NHH7_9APHY|nr:hypothetical protein PHLCEN_2v12321 [Hermanssonia centrifuga]